MLTGLTDGASANVRENASATSNIDTRTVWHPERIDKIQRTQIRCPAPNRVRLFAWWICQGLITPPEHVARCWAAAWFRACRSIPCNCLCAAHSSTFGRTAPSRQSSLLDGRIRRWPLRGRRRLSERRQREAGDEDRDE